MKIAISILGLALAGCVTTSQVVPVGKDTYMVTASNDVCGNCTPSQIRAAEKANAYCSAMSKRMVAQSSTQETFDISFGRKTTLTFSCEAPTN
jgi:hypothetical protein